MIRFIDISNWQGGMVIGVDCGYEAVIVKATEGVNFVDGYCDSFVQRAELLGMPWGFYHFGGGNTAEAEADFFVDNTFNYFGHGIPVLDWEMGQPVEWVNSFVRRVHDRTGTWPWIYANPRFFTDDVEKNCAVWVASYPDVFSPSFSQAESWECPSASGNVVAWQFCSDGLLNVWESGLDCNLFYGDRSQWQAYAKGDRRASKTDETIKIEDDRYIVTVERKS